MFRTFNDETKFFIFLEKHPRGLRVRLNHSKRLEMSDNPIVMKKASGYEHHKEQQSRQSRMDIINDDGREKLKKSVGADDGGDINEGYVSKFME